MKLRRVLAALGVGCALSLVPVIGSAQEVKHHVLFAVTSADESDWKLAMGNARNLISGLPKGSVEVEMVAFGPGVILVKKDSAVAADIKALEDESHVKFFACQNAMRGRNLTVADLLDGTGTVPAGIIEVVTKQEQGWSYIKAGK